MPESLANQPCVASVPLFFTVDPVARTKLLHGWNELDPAANHGEAVAALATRDALARPWMPPR